MRSKLLAILPVAIAGILLSPGTALAHPVGEQDTPSCFGERVSHGSSDHQLTPKERAAGLQEIVDTGDPLAVEIFGETVTVEEFAKFVKVMCSDTPYF